MPPSSGSTSGKTNRFKSVVALDQSPEKKRGGLGRCLGNCAEGLFKGPGRRKDAAGETSIAALKEIVVRSADPKAVARENIVLVMVGLPARGKSYLSGAVFRHLRLLGVRVRSFNAGELRRETGEAGGAGAQADFFSVSNKEAKTQRERLAMRCCESLLEWLRQAPPNTSSVGILDATNTTAERRRRVLQLCNDAGREMAAEEGKYAPLRVIFLESICDDPRLLSDNYKMKLRNDDYKASQDHEAALTDFQARVQAYEAQYEPVEDAELEPEAATAVPAGCVKIINGGQKIVCCRTTSSLVAAPIISLLNAMHLTPRRIVLASLVDESGAGVEPSRLASLLLQAERDEGRPIDVLCSGDRRGAELAQMLEKFSPACDSTPKDAGASSEQPRAVLTLRALKTRHGGEGAEPGMQENYADLVRRMRSEVILLLERLPRSVFVVCAGEDVRRVLVAHFQGCDDGNIAQMAMPKNMAVQLSRDHKGFEATELPLPAPMHKESSWGRIQ